MNEKLQDAFDNAGEALLRLREALEESSQLPGNLLMRDGTIQRFEFCIELLWKLLRRLLLEEKQDVVALPKPIMHKAYAVGWLNEEKLWLDMLDDRNQTSHTYNQQLAKEIYERIKTYYPLMQSTFDRLYSQYHNGK